MSTQSDKAVRLFQFLAQARRLREKPITDLKTFESQGTVIWLSDIVQGIVANSWPIELDHRICDRLGMSLTELPVKDMEEDTILLADRPVLLERPELDEKLVAWFEKPFDNHKRQPKMLKVLRENGVTKRFTDQPKTMQQQAEQWLVQWQQWAAAKKYQEFYQQLFQSHLVASQSSEEYELVLGFGLLTWNGHGPSPIRRHLFTAPVDTIHEKSTGRVRVKFAQSALELKAELDFIPAEILDDRTFVSDVTAKAAEFSSHVLDAELFDELGAITAHSLSTSAVYLPDGAAGGPTSYPVITWAPALILRERRNAGFAQAYDRLAEQIQQSGEVPAGLLSLIDPDQTTPPNLTPLPGAVVNFDDEVFSPLPLNEVQQRIIERVDKHSQTVVQGPPGTGKTHTAAALLSHFLAQGKRVLVTAHTERALYEVRDRLPEEIRELAVSVIGTSTADMADLKVSVDKISRSSAEFDENDSQQAISNAKSNLRNLRERRQYLLAEIATEFRRKSEPLKIPGYELSPTLAMEKVQAKAEKYQWICDLVPDTPKRDFPLTQEEIAEYCTLFAALTDANRKEANAAKKIDIAKLPRLSEFEEASQAIEKLKQQQENIRSSFSRQQWKALGGLPASERERVREQATAIDKVLEDIRSCTQLWASALLEAYDNNQLRMWSGQIKELRNQLDKISTLLQKLADFQRIDITKDTESYLRYAENLAQFLQDKEPLKTDVHGVVKIGIFSPKIVKEGREFFAAVKVDGAQPSTAEQVQAIVTKIKLQWQVASIHEMLPAWLETTENDPATLVMVLTNELNQISSAIKKLSQYGPASKLAQSFQFPPESQSLSMLIQALEDSARLAEISQQIGIQERKLEKLNAQIDRLAAENQHVSWLEKYRIAAQKRDAVGMADALEEAQTAREQHFSFVRFDELEKKLHNWSKLLVNNLHAEKHPQAMLDRVRDIHSALHWYDALIQLDNAKGHNLAQLQGEVRVLESKIHKEVRRLAAERAWYEALNSNRITNRTRKNLVEYARKVSRLGKGTGKNADLYRRDIRKSLDNCRSAVPVWIMPLHRVIDQLDLQGNMFDVVMVDEASQAGSEAAFLQYLAPTIVVIGDDKQVSPSSIGVKEDELRKLADQFLDDDDDKAGWCDTKRSLFDIALARFGGRLTLTEHRRCVPEIIGFSNQIAYQPDNVTLVPVREVSADRLAPFKIVHTPYAYQDTGVSKVNRGEADALIEKLQECLTDPRYAGKTFGVISLLSSSKQADYIQSQLMKTLPTDAWEEHQLRVGSPAEFQGAERDVIFLSMVSSKDENKRLSALVTDEYVQRYNVAVSRAKDQVWLFHSISLDQLTNPEDMRYKLLEYAYSVATRTAEDCSSSRVSDTERVEPFDSLFEQRVYNALVDRGYYVIPQFQVQNYRIDLVVQGADARLAIECDGDHWHGPEHAEKDLARQRELERLGWTFLRIFESDFYLDKEQQLARVWKKLDQMNITANYIHDNQDGNQNITVLTSDS